MIFFSILDIYDWLIPIISATSFWVNSFWLYSPYRIIIIFLSRLFNLDISPYKSEDKVVEHVVVKSDVSKSDIAKAIAELDINELEMLKDKIVNLVDIKKKDLRLKLEKDVA